jgi:phosphatidylserine/phosphatidylglycerophosphate/cardiolipin synthase-like enzyme
MECVLWSNTMKSILFCLVFFAWICTDVAAQTKGHRNGPGSTPPPAIEVYFSPHGGVANAIIKEIEAARSSILVQAYSFDYLPIAEALVAAKRRNVDVIVLLDKDKTSEEKPAVANYLVRSRVSIRLDGAHHTAHNKTIILDGQTVITGSFNFTKHSEKDNAENLLVIHDKALAEKYVANWKVHAEHSTVYESESEDKPSK